MKNLTMFTMLFTLLVRVESGQCFYNAQPGRWLNRDPKNEPGGLSLYGFVVNNPASGVDPLGLTHTTTTFEGTFEGCRPSQEDALREDFADFCDGAKTGDFSRCLGRCPTTIPGRLAWMCNNSSGVTIKCHESDAGPWCNPGDCASSLPGGSVIHLCPSGLRQEPPACEDPLGCHLMHELTHMIGYMGEKWPDKVEQCLGCKGRK